MYNHSRRQSGYVRILVTMLAISCGHAWAYAQQSPSNQAWARQLGTTADDRGQCVAVDGTGNVYIGGITLGSIGGVYAGFYDAFIAKYAHDGTLLWIRQFGTIHDESCNSIAVDGDNNVFIAGYTWGGLGGPSAGEGDAYIAKYSSRGTLLWQRQFGTSDHDSSKAVAVDSEGCAYIAGTTSGSLGNGNAGSNDAFIAKFSSTGDCLWTRQFGTVASDFCGSIAVDGAGDVLVAASTFDSPGAPVVPFSAITCKYSATGDLIWSRNLIADSTISNESIAVDDLGCAIIAGRTRGSVGGPNSGQNDVFVAKYSSDGGLQWVGQFGTTMNDECASVAIDDNGNAVLVGSSFGSLGGTSAGDLDMFVAKYTSEGSQRWIRQFGTPETDACLGTALDWQGNATIAGYSRGSMGGPNAGERDAYVAMFRARPGDVSRDGVVDVQDLLAGIASWGPCPQQPDACQADVVPLPIGDGIVNTDDLLMVIADWGS